MLGKIVRRIFGDGGSKQRQGRWNSKWSRDGFEPEWALDDVPDSIETAVGEGLIEPGAAVLDIGCGAGTTAQWLARRGFEVLGVDFSQAAIQRARKAHADVAGLSFDVVDVTQIGGLEGQFDLLLDRGCLHGIPKGKAQKAYAQNVTHWTKPGALFLLMSRCRDVSVDQLAEEMARLFGASFDLVSAKPCSMDGPYASRPIPGGVLHLMRK